MIGFQNIAPFKGSIDLKNRVSLKTSFVDTAENTINTSLFNKAAVAWCCYFGCKPCGPPKSNPEELFQGAPKADVHLGPMDLDRRHSRVYRWVF